MRAGTMYNEYDPEYQAWVSENASEYAAPDEEVENMVDDDEQEERAA